MKKRTFFFYFFGISLAVLLLPACTKVDYTQIEKPAYLRVFNNFNYGFNMDDKDKKVPFLCMVVNPVTDAKGNITGGQIIGDFLDVRDPYAPPYPSHIGSSTSVNNPEYPGKENVLVGPIVNGYDLSSWAQMPRGALRFVFLYRPKNNVPYFQLEERLRNDIMLDTTLDLESSEVYTLHLLQKNYTTKENGVLLRKESFHKQPLSDSFNYVNFYNYSAEGFWSAGDELKPASRRMGHFQWGIKDRMNVFLTVYPDQQLAVSGTSYKEKALPGYSGKFLTTLIRNTSSGEPQPYMNFPLWANPADNGIVTAAWQSFDFLTPGMTPATNTYSYSDSKTNGNWAQLNCLLNGLQSPSRVNYGASQPNLIVNIHSGIYNPRSFATVSSVEVVNGGVYLTTIQRKYPTPEY